MGSLYVTEDQQSERGRALLLFQQLAQHRVRAFSPSAQEGAPRCIARLSEDHGLGVGFLRVLTVLTLQHILGELELTHNSASLLGHDQLFLGHVEGRILGADPEMSDSAIQGEWIGIAPFIQRDWKWRLPIQRRGRSPRILSVVVGGIRLKKKARS